MEAGRKERVGSIDDDLSKVSELYAYSSYQP
jgi:hypothetical protein